MREDTAWENIYQLALPTRHSGAAAFAACWPALEPQIRRIISHPRFVYSVLSDPERRWDVLSLSWEKLNADDCRLLRRFFLANSSDDVDSVRRFRAWIRRMVRNLAIDYLRSLPDYVRRNGSHGLTHHYQAPAWLQRPGAKMGAEGPERRVAATELLNHLDDSIPQRERTLLRLERSGASTSELGLLLSVPDEEVPKYLERARLRALYRPAVALWVQGFGDAEIAQELGLGSRADAYRILNSARQLLRRHFTAPANRSPPT